jgi:hypothetical protein
LFSNTPNPCLSLNITDQVSHPYRTTGIIIVSYVLIFKFSDRVIRSNKRIVCEFASSYYVLREQFHIFSKQMLNVYVNRCVALFNVIHAKQNLNSTSCTIRLWQQIAFYFLLAITRHNGTPILLSGVNSSLTNYIH